MTRKLAAILVADVVGYSRLAGADEDRILARLRTLRSDLVDPTIAVHNGRVVKRTGDGSLIEFRSVVDAVRCAIEVQTAMVERNIGVPSEHRIEFRVGIHLGDVVEENDGDLMGDGVNIAARLEGIAKPGAICLSEDAYRQVKARLDLAVTDLGKIELKNIAEPMQVYSLQIGTPEPKSARQVRPAIEMPSAPAVPDKPSIAVLAFNNMSGDAEQEYFSDGISEDIITDLSKLSELHVIARNSSFVYKNVTASVPEMAKALGVRYVLEGSVRKAGNRVRVTAQLIDASNGGHIWASRFDRDLTDIFAVQDELTQEIVAALRLNLTHGDQDRLAQGRALNVDAYELLLRGREQASAHTRTGNRAARSLAADAIAIDPQYAAAQALISFTHVLDYVNAWSTDPEGSLRIGMDLAQQAVEMAEEQPNGRFALGMACMWNRELDRAQAEVQQGLALQPNSAELLLLMAHIQIFSGDPAGALETLDASMRLDPHHPEILFQFRADAHFSLGEYEQAIAAIEQRLQQNSQSETAYALLASCYGHLDRPEESRQAWEKALGINPDFSVERRRRVLPFRNPEDFDRRVEGLRKAGLTGSDLGLC
ncbi:adenylate/guanylate cyclase domain-containing protein [Rhizobium leguminosarum]|uniref:adenylate/guanylate cyclase domain-containing protein n=1 Tax=Rhizobium leguminosarum TaxID=384 RepID=UPI001C8FEA97|nr:adenylate/guanylate cyclase domain-containing protein [Rhizobium leguminosarum]MBY2912597.1 adenylate/guanylate cyclase domain-containing protein [Rhizobium leguminosarum]MBY2968254.1 adenylate/guanylate cyclase domain-containing protein [Rhizobium leguminosarum]MBY2975629.1 adenylate/guanylate cyclase domain-containing protein [Rhizobium leguminosarum]MBY2997118.1 adenylate/guanylate cyclase domain-containing protein [Rhizobium leguminosarum]MBY3004179.1 adenylate/guanylate cyclase domain-